MWTCKLQCPLAHYVHYNLFIPTVRYTVEIFTPETFVRTEYRFFISVKGQGELKTTYQLLTVTGGEMQGYDMHMFLYELAVWPATKD